MTALERINSGETIYLDYPLFYKLSFFAASVIFAIVGYTFSRNLVYSGIAFLIALVFGFLRFKNHKKYIDKNGFTSSPSQSIRWDEIIKIETAYDEEFHAYQLSDNSKKVIFPVQTISQDEVIEIFNSLPQLQFVEPTDWRVSSGTWVKRS